MTLIASPVPSEGQLPDAGPVAVGIVGTGSYAPSTVMTNDEIGSPAGVDSEWIARKTGIRQRRFASPDEATSDLALAAARRALHDAGLDPSDLGVIILATSTPDSPQPPTACTVQAALGARGAAAFDMNAVCSGFVFALAAGHRMAGSADTGHVLVIGADTYSRILDRADRRTAVLFGDGAGAVVLGPAPSDYGLIASKLLSFGQHRDFISVPGGGSRRPATSDTVADGLHYFRMDGRAVRDFVTTAIPRAVHEFLDETGTDPDDIRHLVPHQANGVMLGELAGHLRLANATWHSTVEHYGNTSAASIPMTLDAAARDGKIGHGDLVLLVGFGGGMAAGLSLVRWCGTTRPPASLTDGRASGYHDLDR